MFRWLDFKITNRCNRKCVYCGVPHDPPGAPEILSTETIRDTLSVALGSGFTHFALLGGEPSLRDSLETIFGAFRGGPRARSVIAITNGVVFNESLYRNLFDTDAESATLVFSFDSFQKPNYKFQDPHVCLRHIHAIRAIAEEYRRPNRDRSVSVHAVISRENLEDVERLVEFYLELGIDVSLALVCPSRFLRGVIPAAYNEFTYPELEGIVAQLEALDSRGHLNFANRTLLEYLRVFPYDRMRLSSVCRAGRQAVIINPDGEVFPCVPQSYNGAKGFGNVATEDFADICARMDSFRCSLRESPACWDHFLWDRLAELPETRPGKDGPGRCPSPLPEVG